MSSEPALYVVTNTRALPEQDAVSLLRSYVADIKALSDRYGVRVRTVLRGDSTLRGHVRAELDVLGSDRSVFLFVPAFPEGGRVTIGGTHYLRSKAGITPVADTEFACDPVFGYSDSWLPAWFAAHAPGRPVRTVPLAEVRHGPAAIEQILYEVATGTLVIPDAETIEDVKLIVAGLLAAEQSGRDVVLRGAATAVAIRAGVHSAGLLRRPRSRAARTLVICGSHTKASTRQLSYLRQVYRIRGVELAIDPSPNPYAEASLGAHDLAEILDTDGIAFLSTPRTRPPEYGSLSHGAAIMQRLTAVAALIHEHVDACIAKGGITATEVAIKSFDAIEGTVIGQVEAGVSLWRLRAHGRDRDYIVVPGNIGDDQTLANCLSMVTIRPQPRH
jgi:uncharacterized protein YgbK (DUF1537 family)